MFKDFLSLVFPECCYACNDTLIKSEYVLCSYCLHHLPKTNYHLESNNPLKQRLLGRVPVQDAVAYYKFTKGGQVQRLIHSFKYQGVKEIGEFVGGKFGSDLVKAGYSDRYDLVVPVPLHLKKLKKRGYNQAAILAQSIAKELGVEFCNTAIQKRISNQSQTTKTKFIRWKNVNEVYVAESHVFNKRILVVDDVVTTGATLESCCLALIHEKAQSVSIASLAIAQ